MDNHSVIDKVRSLAKGVADANGVELVDVKLLGRGSNTILRVFIDREGGISLNDCATVSRDIEALLDVESPITHGYTLEVSSPGIDRPLKKIEDFVRYKGKKARIVIDGLIENQSFFVGYLKEVRGEEILIELEKKTVAIPHGMIKKARLEIEF